MTAGNVTKTTQPSRNRVLHLAVEPDRASELIDSRDDIIYWTKAPNSGLDSWEEWGEWRTASELRETDDYAHLVFELDPSQDEQDHARALIDQIDPVLEAHWGGAAITDREVWAEHQESVYCEQDFMAGSICARLYHHDGDHDERT